MNNLLAKNTVNQRNSNFELLRILSMVLIIVFHFVYHSQAVHDSPFCVNKVLAYWIGSWGIMGVHCFFFISAWFLQEKERKFNSYKLYSIFFQIMFYAVIVLTIGSETGIISINLKTITQSVVYWYITAYVIMYLMSPFLNKFISLCNKRSLGILVLILTVVFPLQFTIYPITRLSDVDLVIYDYLLIAYFKKSETNWFEKNRYRGLVFCLFMVYLAEFAILYLLGSADLADKFTGRYSIFQIMIAVFVFYIFKNMKFQSGVINALTKSTLAVYIIHEGVLSGYLRNQVLGLDMAYKTPYYVIYILAAAIIVYLSITLVDQLRNFIYIQFTHIFKPYINKVLIVINTWFDI